MRSPAALYLSFLLKRPTVVLAGLFLLLAFFAFHARDFQLDASAESLLLEDDRDLQLLREVSARYQTADLLIVTYTPPWNEGEREGALNRGGASPADATPRRHRGTRSRHLLFRWWPRHRRTRPPAAVSNRRGAGLRRAFRPSRPSRPTAAAPDRVRG